MLERWNPHRPGAIRDQIGTKTASSMCEPSSGYSGGKDAPPGIQHLRQRPQRVHARTCMSVCVRVQVEHEVNTLKRIGRHDHIVKCLGTAQ